MLWLGLAELGSIWTHFRLPELDAGITDQYAVDAEDPVEQLTEVSKKSEHARSWEWQNIKGIRGWTELATLLPFWFLEQAKECILPFASA